MFKLHKASWALLEATEELLPVCAAPAGNRPDEAREGACRLSGTVLLARCCVQRCKAKAARAEQQWRRLQSHAACRSGRRRHSPPRACKAGQAYCVVQAAQEALKGGGDIPSRAPGVAHLQRRSIHLYTASLEAAAQTMTADVLLTLPLQTSSTSG